MNARLSSLLNQAAHLFSQGDLPNAEAALKHALVIAPRNPDALSLLGIISFQRGDIEASLQLLHKAVKARPGDATGYYNLGNVFLRVGDHSKALEFLDRAGRLNPDDYWIRVNHGICLANLKRFEEAKHSFDRAIAIDPSEAAGWRNLALCLEESGRYTEALQAYDEAIQRRPDYPDAWSGKGSTLHKLERFDEALAHFDKAIQFNPAFAEAWSNKGGTLHELRRHAEALGCFDRAIEVQPEYADSYWNKSLTQLLLGDFQHGWSNYRYRWKTRHADPHRHSELPELDSVEKARGKTILVWAEQGLGDTLQFSRYIALLAGVGAQVIFEVHPELCPLLEGQLACRVIPKGAGHGSAHLQIPLLDLPFLFHTRLDSIPAEVPYLRATPQSIARWERVLGRAGDRLNVGIACSGSPGHQNDTRRSFPLEQFEPLAQAANCYLLQKEIRDSDRAFLRTHPEILFLGEEIGNFEDTAALVSILDLIVSVDTSLVHLAGALGRPVYVLLPWAPDWRWMLDRKDSPWYPSACLFRQPAYRDWISVIEEVAAKLSDIEKPSR